MNVLSIDNHKFLGVFLLWLFLCGCDEEKGLQGTEVGTQCLEEDLIAQCPVGTTPLLSANASSSCQAESTLEVSGDFVLGSGEGGVSRVCAGLGNCQVVCELQEPCIYGVERLSREEVLCAEAPNCDQRVSRCYGDQIQSCDLQGRWENPRPCPSNFSCLEMNGEASCIEIVTEAGVQAGIEAGMQTGIEAGVQAGTEAGVLAGTEAGVQAGTEAGIEVMDKAPCYSSNRGCPDLDFVRISDGNFMMGSNEYENEQPVHMVSVDAFEMMRTEVTVAQYKTCVDAGICSEPSTDTYCNWNVSGREDHPINCVDWDQAMNFAAWVGGNLPTEAQWEYAARSEGEDWIYPWGNETASCEYAVMNDGSLGCGENGTWEVCLKPRGNTQQGLCDMIGNLYEWVQDAYQDSYNDAPINASNVCRTPRCLETLRRVYRGGSWYGSDARYLRATDRRDYGRSGRDYSLGFRVLLSLP